MAVVFVTGAFILMNSIGMWVLSALQLPAPAGMDTMIGTALGYMGGILTSTKGTSEPQDVTVTNKPNDPVPVSDEGTK